jgi:hypothetical protein
MSRSKRSFREYSRLQQRLIVVLTVTSLVLVGAAERDIQRRPANRVRGSKSLWRLLCLNAIGAASYFRWGRQAAQD